MPVDLTNRLLTVYISLLKSQVSPKYFWIRLPFIPKIVKK